MFERHEHAPRCVYLLADSLDSILAASEDLLRLPNPAPAVLLRLELTAITHVLQARQRVNEIDLSEPALVEQFVLFLAGTAALDLEHLRHSRSVRLPSPAPGEPQISDSYLIGGQLPIAFLAELTAATLDALEAHFVLYEESHLGITPSPTSATSIHTT
jgi:hypothetical protein